MAETTFDEFKGKDCGFVVDWRILLVRPTKKGIEGERGVITLAIKKNVSFP